MESQTPNYWESEMKKNFVKATLAGITLAFGVTATGAIAQERSSICDMEPTSFNVWFLQKFYC